MAYERFTDESLNYDLCEYPGSRLRFRGPRRDLTGDYVAFLGGTDTFGKYIVQPFPDLVEQALNLPCVNFGWCNAGADVFVNDEGVLDAARRARAVVLQLPCAQNMSNRYYSVHPRRNDRFLGPTALMRNVFPEVDFTEFNFTRHLLRHLQAAAPDRFATLRKELQTLWISRMRLLLSVFDQPVVLLWLSKRRPGERNDRPDLALDPALVTRPMIEAIERDGTQFVQVCASVDACVQGTQGMVYSEMEETAAAQLLGPVSHAEAAEALVPLLRSLLA